jgi:monoamine oxidase
MEVRKLMNDSEEEIEKAVISAIEDAFEPSLGAIPKPKKVYIANWSNELWSGGCYAGIMPPGIWTGYENTLRKSVGSIHWASTETANKWFA